MKSYTSSNPEFSEEIKVVETTDPAHADVINAAPKKLLENTLVNRQNVDSLNTVTFEVVSERKNIESGENRKITFGKIAKFFADIKAVAFSGSYNDLLNKPVIPTAVRVKGNAEASYRTGDVNLTPENIGAVNKAGDTINGTLHCKTIMLDSYTQLDKEKICSGYDNFYFEVSHNFYGTELNIIQRNDTFSLLPIETNDNGCKVFNMGNNSYRWTNIYATNGAIQTSDRNQKNNIEELSAKKAQQFIYGLKPSTYQMNAGTSGRTHWGMISQDIEELFEELGMTSLDFAGFIKSPKVQRITTDENGKELQKPIEKVIEGEYDYSLRYDEFIAPLIKVVQAQHETMQKQDERIEALEKRVDFLEQKLSALR